jgi:hypothetical protein
MTVKDVQYNGSCSASQCCGIHYATLPKRDELTFEVREWLLSKSQCSPIEATHILQSIGLGARLNTKIDHLAPYHLLLLSMANCVGHPNYCWSVSDIFSKFEETDRLVCLQKHYARNQGHQIFFKK